MIIRETNYEAVREEILSLWKEAFQDCSVWQTSPAFIDSRLAKQRIWGCFEQNQMVGFVAVSSKDPGSSLSVVAIKPEHQRQGIGSRLLAVVEKELRGRVIEVGSGYGPYFWSGIPETLSGATGFFQKNGFQTYEESFDLILKLDSFKGTAPVSEKWEIGLAGTEEAAQLTAFQGVFFPSWAKPFEDAIEENRFNDILVARSDKGEILGSVLLSGPSPHLWSSGGLGQKVGTLGALGVHPEWREQGLGFALADEATAWLKRRGCDVSFVGWTWLVDWYGKLGYTVFQKYLRARKSA